MTPPPLPEAGRVLLSKISETPGGILVVTHLRADGDGWGSLFGLSRLLHDAGRTVYACVGEHPPWRYERLPIPPRLISTETPPSPEETPLLIVVDTPTTGRITPGGERLLEGRTVLRIDHHRSTENFGTFEWVDPGAAASAVMIASMAKAAGWTVSREAATCLYAGILADTGGFRYENTNADALETAAWLARFGIDLGRIGRDILDRQSRAAVALRTLALRRARWRCDGMLVGTRTEPADYRRLGALPEDAEGLVEFLRCIEGVRVAVLADRPPGSRTTRISWRTVGFNAVPLARAFGGGGHPGAAGADRRGDPREIFEEVMTHAETALRSAGISRSR